MAAVITTGDSDKTWQRWHDEMELAGKAKGYDNWQTRSKRIIKRYRDERPDVSSDSDTIESSRFNILWSNVQTLQPALFAKSPKPVVERRYLDRDDVGRTASVILERCLNYELDDGLYHQAIRKAVLDRLLPGRGVVWVRYEPKFTPMPGKTQEVKDDDGAGDRTGSPRDGDTAGEPASGAGELDGDDGTAAEPEEQVASESVPVDYIDWNDFETSPSRTWEEVWWIRKRVYMTRDELKKRFTKKMDDGKTVGECVPLDWAPNQQVDTKGQVPDLASTSGQKRAKILEIWDKSARKVYWMAETWGEEMLDERDDPLKLDCFWPVPKPLFSTLTNDTLIPVPDFAEYQDQASELDDLTGRIAALTRTIKAAGIYDSSIPELQRMFEEGFENKLVPSDNMAEFSQKAGATGQGVIWMLPIVDMAKTLNELYSAREQVKQSLYEITGISDIVRGSASQGGAKTATEQRIKGQFASMRLNEMQAEVARFCRDTLRIMGEIIAEHFDPMTLFEVSGFEQYAKEQWPPEPAPPIAGPNPAMMGHNGPPPGPLPGTSSLPGGMGAPGGGGPPPGMLPPAGPPPVGFPQNGPAQGMIPPVVPIDPAAIARAQAEADARAKAVDMFKKAVTLLRNDKLRGFRIDIETDSIIEPDQQAMQQARTELMGAISQFLPQAMEAGKSDPSLRPLLARLLMFFLRGFKASRDIEAAFEQFIDDMQKQAANPKPAPPSPEQLKAQAETAKQENENKRMQAQALIDQQTAKDEAAAAAAKHQMEMEKLGAEERIARVHLELERQKALIAGAAEVHKAELDARGRVQEHLLSEREADMQHERNLEAQRAKPKPGNGAEANG